MKVLIGTGAFALFLILIPSTPPALAATISVPMDYSTIQEAIDAVVDGDLILVAAGTYVENIDFLGKAITLQSEVGAEATVIDGSQVDSVVTFASGEPVEAVTYIRSGQAETGKPSKDYLAVIQQGYKDWRLV